MTGPGAPAISCEECGGYGDPVYRIPAASPLTMCRRTLVNTIEQIEAAQLRDDIPEFAPGDNVRVHVRVIEGGRERIQVFEGVVIARSGGSGARATFTVRKLSFGVGVERIFPVHSPIIQEIEVTRKGDVRRAKLYYLRDRVGKATRIKEKRD